MKKLIFLVAVALLVSSCGTAIDSGTYRQLKTTTDDFLRVYSDKYKDDTWGNENFGRIYHPGFYREGKLAEKLSGQKIVIDTVEGLKIYNEVSRKDIVFLKSDNSYLIRNDFKVIAVLNKDGLSVFKPEKIISQYYWLQTDKEDQNLYKIIDTYPTIMNDEFIYQNTFIDNYKDFTQDESIKAKVGAL